MSNEITNLESFLFTEKKEDFLKKLIQGTDSHSFFSLTNALNKHGANLPQEYQDMLNTFKKTESQNSNQVWLRYLLLKLDSATSDSERKNLISQINEKYLKLNLAHSQINNAIGQNMFSTDVTQAKSDSLDRSILQTSAFMGSGVIDRINQIEEFLLTQVDLTLLEKYDIQYTYDFLSRVGESLSIMSGVPRLLNFIYNKMRWDCLRFLTVSQMKELVNLQPNILKEQAVFIVYLAKTFVIDERFSQRMSGLPTSEHMEEKKKLLKDILQWMKGLPSNRVKFQDFLLRNLLLLGLQSNEFDFDLFVQFLKEPTTTNANFNQIQMAKYYEREQVSQKTNDLFQDTPISNILRVPSTLTDDQIIQKYAHKYLELYGTYDIFTPYFEESFLKTQLIKIELFNGKSVPDVTKYLDTNQIQSITEKKYIKITATNQRLFKAGEEVSIEIVLKNIPQLLVKVFEFNTENYYKKTLAEINTSIELDGLIASEESSFEFTQPPIQKFIKTFKFENISKKKQGVFVIDFVGNGISSRAIVSKGCLVIREKKTIAGHAFQILDEDLNVCKGSKTGIFFQRKFYPLNSDDEVLIPYADKVVNGKAILVYNFKCAFLYNTQSMLMSSKGRVLLQPRIYLNNQIAPLSILKDAKVTVESINAMGISSSTIHSKIDFSLKAETEIEFPVPSKVVSITIKVETKVKTMTYSEELSTQSVSEVINFNQHEGDSSFCIQNLRYTKSGYELYLLGQNGEPKVGVSLNLDFKIRGYSTLISSQLTTNAEGFVRLLELENVEYMTCHQEKHGDITSSDRTWTIENVSQLNYPENLQITTSDIVQLPYLGDKSNVHFMKILESAKEIGFVIVSNETSRVEVENKAIKINSLPTGRYKLVMRDIKQSVIITVFQGSYWKQSDNILTEEGLLNQQQDSYNLCIEDVRVETPKEGEKGNRIEIKLQAEQTKHTRVHLLAFHYLSDDINILAERLDMLNVPNQSDFIDTRKAQKGNTFQSNKKIGDEIRYALDRKRLPRFIGNTLDKPHLLLKRTFIRDTTYEQETVNQGIPYQDASVNPPVIEKSSTLQKQNNRHSKTGWNHTKNNQLNVDYYNNYLLHPTLLLSNLKPDKDGLVTVSNINLSNYSTIQIIATDLFNSILIIFLKRQFFNFYIFNQRLFNKNKDVVRVEPLDKNEVEKRNLCQRLNKQMDKFFTISRTNELIPKGSEFKSTDFTSTELQLVDSIPKLFAAQKELRKISGKDKEQTQGYDFWDFLPKWQGYSLEEKLKKYDQFACHELNLFIFCKDPPFFIDFVKPFILNKIEKTFIDHFLTNNSTFLLKAASSSSISKLNALELILLLFFLKQVNQIDQAKGIFNFLESTNKVKKYDSRDFKKLFDTVLNAKTEAEAQNSSIDPTALINQININISNIQNQGLQQQPVFNTYAPMQQVSQGFQGNNIYPAQTQAFGGIGYSFPVQQQMQQMQQMPQMMMQQQQQQQQNTFGMQRSRNVNLRMQQQQQQPMNAMNQYQFGDIQQENACLNPSKYESKRVGFVAPFRNMEKTKEYGERHYYSQKTLDSQQDIVPVNTFWVDLARHILTHGQDKPFLSSNFIYCASNHTQMIAALSFLALPFEIASHTYESFEGKGIKITMNTNCIVFAKQIKEGKANIREDILISQKFFDPIDRYVFSDENPDDKYEKQITEYIVDKRYGCQVIVTNCSASRHELQVLVEIPSGSIPVTTNDYTKTHNITLEPFSTKPIEFFFYFPQSGKQEIYPSNVAKSGEIVAVAKPAYLDVLERGLVTNLETMNDILQKGSKEDILNFVATKNILNPNIFSFNEVYYLLKDKNFYQKFIDVIKNRKVYDQTVWSYSIMHGDFETFSELLNSSTIKEILQTNLVYFDSNTCFFDKNRLFEYHPLSNPRVHLLHQDKSNILNRQFREQYSMFLQYLLVKSVWSISDRLGLVYYFLLQDRIEEAITNFDVIDPNELKASHESELQYDYFSSYLDLFVGFPNFKRARELCEKYLDYPIVEWRNLFYEVANKLAEYDGEEEEHSLEGKSEQIKKANNKKKEEISESLEVKLVEETNVEITLQNIRELTLNYYIIDLEILFSRNPFLSTEKSDFGFVKPNHSETIQNPNVEGLHKILVTIPEKYHSSNMCIEVSSPNTQATLMYFSTSLKLQPISELGQIKVLDKDSKPLSKVYVKCFAKKSDNSVMFYKDGYTDLVGRFDYASRSSSDISQILNFSIFVMSDELGAIIKEINPPTQLGQIVEEVKLKGTQWNKRADQRTQNQQVSYASHQVTQMACKNAFY